MPYFILVPMAAQDGGGGSGGGSLGTLLLIPVMVGAFYFLLLRPQRKRQKEMSDLQSSIEVGDEITTTSGIYGFVTGVEDDVYWVEIDDDVQIRIAKAAVAGRVNPVTAADTSTKESAKKDSSQKNSASKDSAKKDSK